MNFLPGCVWGGSRRRISRAFGPTFPGQRRRRGRQRRSNLPTTNAKTQS